MGGSFGFFAFLLWLLRDVGIVGSLVKTYRIVEMHLGVVVGVENSMRVLGHDRIVTLLTLRDGFGVESCVRFLVGIGLFGFGCDLLIGRDEIKHLNFKPFPSYHSNPIHAPNPSKTLSPSLHKHSQSIYQSL